MVAGALEHGDHIPAGALDYLRETVIEETLRPLLGGSFPKASVLGGIVATFTQEHELLVGSLTGWVVLN